MKRIVKNFAWYLTLSLVAAAALVAVPLSGQAADTPLTVFAAASLKNALDDVGAAYTKQRHGAVRFSYAASSVLAKQIDSGAPADIFISADTDWMNYAVQHKDVDGTTRQDLLSNHLALIAPAASTVQLALTRDMKLVTALNGGRLAIAGPEVPAGKYARAALQTLNVLSSVQDRLAPADSVRSTLLLVARGETPLGIVYDTDAKVEPKVRIVGLFPDDSHPRIVYPVAIVERSKNAQAPAFVSFLRSPMAIGIFTHYGFTIVPH